MSESDQPVLRHADLFHTGIVVDDLATAKSELAVALGVTWREGGAAVRMLTDDGACTVRTAYALSREGPHHIELVQSIEGTLWTTTAPGHAHHLGYWADDVAATSAALVRSRIREAGERRHGRRCTAHVRVPPGEERALYRGSRSGHAAGAVAKGLTGGAMGSGKGSRGAKVTTSEMGRVGSWTTLPGASASTRRCSIRRAVRFPSASALPRPATRSPSTSLPPGTSTRSSIGSRSRGSGAARGRWRAERSRFPRWVTRSSTKSPTGRSSWCAPRRTRSGRSTTRAFIAGRSSEPGPVGSPDSAARTTGSPGTWTARSVRSLAQWDFPQIDQANFCLPQARVGTWGGFVFVNVDPHGPPLEEYLENLPWHFADWPLEDRYLSAHVVRVMPCNWKVALEAFIEGVPHDGGAPAAASDGGRLTDRVRRLSGRTSVG